MAARKQVARAGCCALAVALLVAAGGSNVREGPATAAPDSPVIELGRGLNLGNALEAPYEGAWGVVLEEAYFALIRGAGFDTVRVPVRWSAHAATDPPYTIAEGIFRRVDWVLEQALASGLVVVINVHHYDEIMADPEGHKERFISLWAQISRRYADQPAEVVFELLNEPHGRLTAPVWNEIFPQALQAIRETNPTRWVVVGPVNWNHAWAMPSLELPAEDRYLIATFHYYEPFWFTHQGARWVSGSRAWLGTRWMGTEAERRSVERDLDLVVRWAVAHGRPLFLGEFGAYGRADMASRVRWTSFVARQAESRGIPWAYWEFCAGFGVYDPAGRRWRDELLRALIPPEN